MVLENIRPTTVGEAIGQINKIIEGGNLDPDAHKKTDPTKPLPNVRINGYRVPKTQSGRIRQMGSGLPNFPEPEPSEE